MSKTLCPGRVLVIYACVRRCDPGDSSLSVIVTHTQAHEDTVLGNPSGPPSSHQRAADRTPWTRLIHNAHREETQRHLPLPPLPPSYPLLAKAKKEKKE